MNLDWNDIRVGAKVRVGREDSPFASNGNTADQKINARSGKASTTAFGYSSALPVRNPHW
jgi:hypothetical protein